MSTSTRVSVEQYDAMIEAGAFEPKEEHHVELIDGEIVPMSPTGLHHDSALDRLTDWSFEVLPRGSVWVRVQGSVGLPAQGSVPQPDLAWLRRLNYLRARPGPDDVLLLVEVSDSSLAKDRGVKARIYARAGIRDYWLVNLAGRTVEVRRDPSAAGYATTTVFKEGESVRPLAFPEVALAVSRLFEE